jgi:hypothetical protein
MRPEKDITIPIPIEKAITKQRHYSHYHSPSTKYQQIK